MAIEQFPNSVIVKTADTGEEVFIAQLTLDGIIDFIRLNILTENLSGNEKLTLEVREVDNVTVISASDTIELGLIEGFSTAYWLAWVRFAFSPGAGLSTGKTVNVWMKTADYTRVGDSTVLNIIKTYLNPTYATSETSAQRLPADLQIFKRDY